MLQIYIIMSKVFFMVKDVCSGFLSAHQRIFNISEYFLEFMTYVSILLYRIYLSFSDSNIILF